MGPGTLVSGPSFLPFHLVLPVFTRVLRVFYFLRFHFVGVYFQFVFLCDKLLVLFALLKINSLL